MYKSNTCKSAQFRKKRRQDEPMIASITLNPCRDKTLVVSKLICGELNRVLESREDMSGKGVNVSAVLKGLGKETICLGFNFTLGCDDMEESLKKQSIPFDFITCPGKIRTNAKVFEKDSGIMTEINEKGDFVSKKHLELLLEKTKSYCLSGKAKMFIISGSAPQGVPDDYYAQIITAVKAINPSIPIALDAEGELLRHGIKAGPEILKPNLHELASVFGIQPDEKGKLKEKCRELISSGIKMICVSMGAEGAMLINESRALRAHAIKVKVKSLQGAGDSMMAGICSAWIEGGPLEEILRFGVAAAAGTIEREGTLMCRLDDFNRLHPLVKIAEMQYS
jgi:1-phosphofructokinase